MKKIYSHLLVGLFLGVGSVPLTAFSHDLYIGPEVYWLNRAREHGATQDGFVYGVRASYDYIKRYNLYWGAEAFYGAGTLNGKSVSGGKLRSHYRDFTSEARFGYTFQQKCDSEIFFTPYIGGGYGVEDNNFVDPSPIPVHFRLKYWYGSTGFFSGGKIRRNIYLGINFKAKYIANATSHVTHDPEFDSLKLVVGNAWQYRFEMPLTYEYCDQFYISLMPFVEYREFGGNVNFPFDFLKTTLRMYGATLKFIKSF